MHADVADRHGNAVIRGPVGEAVVAAQGAGRVVVVAEEVLPVGERVPSGCTLPGIVVDAVVEQPGAVWPDGAIGHYDRDVEAYESYVSRASTVDGFASWLLDVTGQPEPIR